MGSVKCPICRKAVDPAANVSTFPFCCDRCRLVDLNRWMTEDYPVPIETERVARELLEEQGDDSYPSEPLD